MEVRDSAGPVTPGLLAGMSPSTVNAENAEPSPAGSDVPEPPDTEADNGAEPALSATPDVVTVGACVLAVCPTAPNCSEACGPKAA